MSEIVLVAPVGLEEEPVGQLGVTLPPGTRFGAPGIDPAVVALPDRCGPDEPPPDVRGFTCADEGCGFNVLLQPPGGQRLALAADAVVVITWIRGREWVEWRVQPGAQGPVVPSQLVTGVPDADAARKLDAGASSDAIFLAPFLATCGSCAATVAEHASGASASPGAVELRWPGGAFRLVAEKNGYNRILEGDAIRVGK